METLANILTIHDQFLAAVNVATCRYNGEVVPCDQLTNMMGPLFGAFWLLFLVVFVFGILSTIFWVWMLVHVATHEMPNKTAWILVIVFTGFIGALIYYFVEKKKVDNIMHSSIQAAPSAPVQTPPPAAKP